MRAALALSLSPAELLPPILAGVLVLLLAAIGVRWWRRSRLSPEERERNRRARIVAVGKMGDATIVDFRDDHIFYCYGVRGVEYTASQDISALKQSLPPDFSTAAIGPVLVKYDPRNPANSVILSEQWSGMRANIQQN